MAAHNIEEHYIDASTFNFELSETGYIPYVANTRVTNNSAAGDPALKISTYERFFQQQCIQL